MNQDQIGFHAMPDSPHLTHTWCGYTLLTLAGLDPDLTADHIDRTPGLQKNADGSIDIWITQKQPIDLNRLENWLPAPMGVFRLMIRAYAPSELFQSGEILPPDVERLT